MLMITILVCQGEVKIYIVHLKFLYMLLCILKYRRFDKFLVILNYLYTCLQYSNDGTLFENNQNEKT